MPKRSAKKLDALSHLFDLAEVTIHGVQLAEQPVEVEPQNRSRYTTISPNRKASVGMGYLKAVGAPLCGLVEAFEVNAEGTVGRANILSSSSTGRYYHLSWNMLDPSLSLFGGFPQELPGYQIAILQLIACSTNPNNAILQHWSQEVFQRWYEVLLAIHMQYPSSQHAPYWEPAQLQDLFDNPMLAPHFEALADALYFCLRYQLPATDEAAKRMIQVKEHDVVPPNERLTRNAPGTFLLGFFVPTPSAQPSSAKGMAPASAGPPIGCPNPLCGQDNPASETYCTNCGAYLDPTLAVGGPTPVPTGAMAALHPQYTGFQEIGRGGMGIVYKALDSVLGRQVAIKEHYLNASDPQKAIEASNAFKREARFIAGLAHPCIPRVYEYRVIGDQHFLLMELIDGETLDLYVQRTGLPVDPGDPTSRRRLPIREVLEIGVTLCEVLAYLHTRTPKIIYRDLKPQNVMISRKGALSLVDFGAARHFTPGHSRDTVALGSVGFAAPEQYGKKYQTDERSDIYNLGATLHALITGFDPSESPFLFEPFLDPPLSLSVPGEMETLILGMVSMEMSKRPPTARAVLHDLRRIQSILGF